VLTPLYYASLLGLTDVVKWLEDQGLDCSCAGGRYGFPLQAAVVGGHENVVKHLLNRHVKVSEKGGQYGAAIIAAAAVSTPEIVEILLVAGADVTSTDESGLTALHYAAKRGNVHIVRHLLDHEADINAVTSTSTTALHLACISGHKDVVALLASRGANLKLADSAADMSLLQIALWNRDVDIATHLLDKGVSPNELFPNGQGPLHSAIWSSKMVQILISKGADPNLPQKRNWTPLQMAAAYGELESITALIEAGADISGEPTVNEGMYSPLQMAIANECLDAARLLLHKGAAVDQKTQGGLTALLIAVRMKSLEAVNFLLDAGASLQCVWEHTQQSLFDFVADGSEAEIAQLLVRHGCFRIQNLTSTAQEREAPAGSRDENSLAILAYDGDLAAVGNWLVKHRGSIAPNILGEALHAASARGHVDVVMLLLENRAQVNLRDINGRTALHHATRHLHYDVADGLVERGASISLEDVIGSTPIDLAVVHGMQSVGFIRKHMDNFTLNISRRPSLLATTPNQAANFTVMGARKAISGAWAGHYECLSWLEGRRDEFSIDIPAEPPKDSRPCIFSSKNEDIVGPFQFHGFVDPIGTIWFVKLYKHHGWLYRGQLNSDQGVFKGTWGSNRKLWFGTFELRRKE
jgi:ankyrin repeat protein